ncbi:hypothetical protein ACIGO9_28565 [Nocardia asteroides]|uniref:hypothetical protein n=1 Tax=Nocardia asteroides TaxID=1824 RepID=UPI0037CB8DD0
MAVVGDVIRNVRDLRDLPEGTVIVGLEGDPYPLAHQLFDYGWEAAGEMGPVTIRRSELPVQIVFMPATEVVDTLRKARE